MSIHSFEVLEHGSNAVSTVPADWLTSTDDEFIFDAFLLYPAHRAFLMGESTWLAGCPRAAWMIGLLLLLTLFASLFLFMMLPGWQDASELNTNGQLVEARVESRRMTEDREGTRSYYLSYGFWADETGRYYSREQSVGRATYEQSEEDAAVSVRYLPSNPNRSTLTADHTESTARTVGAVLVAVAGLAALISFMVLFVRRHRHDTLVRRGWVLPSEVIQFSSRTDSGGHFHIDLRYRVMSPAKHAIVQQVHRRADELRCCPRPKPGDPVVVIYVDDRRFRLL